MFKKFDKFQQQIKNTKMNRKLATIQLLKQKINDMQGRLNKLQTQVQVQATFSKSKSKTKSKIHSKSPSRNTSSNARYKSPTFWGGNPILGESNKYQTQKHPSPNFKQIRRKSKNQTSLITQKIKNEVNQKFYQSATVQAKINQQENICPTKTIKTGYFGKRFEHRFFENRRDNLKNQKIKTYQKGLRDPILNPQPSKPIGKKILHHQEYSPQKLQSHYTQNPLSNPNVYFNATTMIPITLSPKNYNTRNKSPDLKLLLSSSAQNLSNYQSKKSSKKHFSRYFQQNIASKWSTNW